MDFYKMHKWPTIRFYSKKAKGDWANHIYNGTSGSRLDNQGNYVQVSFSNQQRSRTLSYDDETMHSLYKALMLYNNVMYSPELFLTHKLNEGQQTRYLPLRCIVSICNGNVDSNCNLQEIAWCLIIRESFMVEKDLRSSQETIGFIKDATLPGTRFVRVWTF